MRFVKVGAPWAPASSPKSSVKIASLASAGEHEVAPMAKKEDRIIIHLACTECRERTYTTSKNRRNDPERLELNKFCPRCRQHRPHRETR